MALCRMPRYALKVLQFIDGVQIPFLLLEKVYDYNIEIEMLFIDFKQAFARVTGWYLIKALEELKIPHKVKKLMQLP